VEVAFQLCHPNGPYAKKQVAQALDLARGSLYLKRKQAQKDKQVAVAIEAWHEKDDTMGHRKLGALLHMGKNRVKRVMKKYEIAARRKRKKYVYPGKTSSTVPNLLRESTSQTPQAEQAETQNREDQLALAGLTEIIFSDIFEVQLADHTKVRGCFALWKQTRHILAIAFENHMRADLVVSTIDLIEHVIPGTIFHSDQGSQYGAEQTRAALLQKGFIRSMSRAGTPTDNGFAERFVGQFKLSVAERRSYHTLGMFLQAAEDWINFYNHLRPHESLDDLSPDQFAQLNGLPVAEPIRLMTAPNRVAAVSDAAMAATSVPHGHVLSRHATLLP
jgi:transposase InsO family protein